MPCVLHERASDLWVLVFLSAGLQPWLMRRLGPGSLPQISSVVMRAGRPACHARSSTMPLLLSQRCLTSVVKGQPGNVFYSDHSASLVSGKDFPSLAHVCGRAHTHTHTHTHTHITLSSSASPFSAQPLSSHATEAHRPPPPANKNMKNGDSEMELPAMAQGKFG